MEVLCRFRNGMRSTIKALLTTSLNLDGSPTPTHKFNAFANQIISKYISHVWWKLYTGSDAECTQQSTNSWIHNAFSMEVLRLFESSRHSTIKESKEHLSIWMESDFGPTSVPRLSAFKNQWIFKSIFHFWWKPNTGSQAECIQESTKFEIHRSFSTEVPCRFKGCMH
jgi:hypothetical protein